MCMDDYELKRLKEKQKQLKRERAAEKRRKKTRDKHRMQGLEHTRKYKKQRRDIP